MADINLTKEQNNLLNEWSYRVNKSQVGHYLVSEKYTKIHYFLGVSLIILTGIVTSSLFIKIEDNWISHFIILISISASILATIQTFIMPSEKAEVHRVKAYKYGIIKRKIELYTSLDSKEDFNIFSKKIREEWDSIASESPVTAKRTRDKISHIISRELEELKNSNHKKI